MFLRNFSNRSVAPVVGDGMLVRPRTPAGCVEEEGL